MPLLKAAAGTVINVSSTVAQRPLANMSVYSASKAAVAALTKSWARELAGYGVRVNSLGVGSTESPIYEKAALSEEAAKAHLDTVRRLVPMRRFGSAEEVAAVAAFLDSDDASFVTGADYAVDGGAAA